MLDTPSKSIVQAMVSNRKEERKRERTKMVAREANRGGQEEE